MALDFVCVRVKKEQDWVGVSEAAVSADLYAGHEVKEEMVLGPEVLQPPDVAFVLRNQDRDKTHDFPAAVAPLAAPCHPGPGSMGAPVKQEYDAADIPMVRIHSPYGFDDLYLKTNTPPATDLKLSESQTSPNLQKYWALYDIRPCFIPLVYVDSVLEYRSVNKSSTEEMRETIDSGTKENGSESKSSTEEMRKPTDSVTNENGSESNSSTEEMRKPKKFFCDFCGKGFSLKQSLLVHIRIHTGEKPHSCHVCRKKFSDMSILIRHRRIHTGEKPHVCDVCKKQFSEKYLLKYHKRLHTGETAYACRLCSKTFNHISNYKRHMRTHEKKPFVCEICNQHFKEESKLETHLLSHLKNKPFSCDTCNKSFTNTGHLNRHMTIHFDDKKHYCKVCKVGFTQLGSLKRHEIRNVCRKR